MIIDLDSGWIDGIRRVRTENCDARPPGCRPELIVVHGISLPPGEFGGGWVDRLFQNDLPAASHPYFAEIQDLRVSSHVLIARDGSCTQYVSFADRAWHAGESSYHGRAACNDYSVGIELEGTDELPYDPRQYESLARLILALRAAYPSLSNAEIVGHSDVAPGRKTDPGPRFDWALLRRLLASGED